MEIQTGPTGLKKPNIFSKQECFAETCESPRLRDDICWDLQQSNRLTPQHSADPKSCDLENDRCPSDSVQIAQTAQIAQIACTDQESTSRVSVAREEQVKRAIRLAAQTDLKTDL